MGRRAKPFTATVAAMACSLLAIGAGESAAARDREVTLELGGVSYHFVPPEGLCPLGLDHASLALPIRQFLYARKVTTQFEEGLGLVLWLVDCGWLRRIDNLDHFYGPFFPARNMAFSVPVRPNGQFGTMGSTSREAYLARLEAANDETPWPASDAEALAAIRHLVETVPASDERRTPPGTLLARREREENVVYSADLTAQRSSPSRIGGQGAPYWQVSASILAISVVGDFPLVLRNADMLADSLPVDRLQAEVQAVLRQFRSQDGGRP